MTPEIDEARQAARIAAARMAHGVVDLDKPASELVAVLDSALDALIVASQQAVIDRLNMSDDRIAGLMAEVETSVQVYCHECKSAKAVEAQVMVNEPRLAVAAVALLADADAEIARWLVNCVQCRGNGRIELLEHCPVCGGSGERHIGDILYSALQHALSDEPQWRGEAGLATQLYLERAALAARAGGEA